jgi:hypothetical protein
MCLHYLVGQEGPMTVSTSPNALRWLVMILLAPVVALSAQVLVLRLAWMALAGMSRDSALADWTVWAAKCATCPFMGAAFVAAVWWMAPTRKSAASTMALVVVVGWGGLLMAGTYHGNADGMLNWWPSVMGMSGIGIGSLERLVGCRSLVVHGAIRVHLHGDVRQGSHK